MHFDYFLLANSISSQVVFIITQLYCVFGKPWLFSSVVDCPLVPLPNFFKIKIQVSGFVKLMFYVCCLLANCWLLSAYTFLKTNFLTNHLTNCEQTPLIDLYFSKSPWTKAAPSGKSDELSANLIIHQLVFTKPRYIFLQRGKVPSMKIFRAISDIIEEFCPRLPVISDPTNDPKERRQLRKTELTYSTFCSSTC